MFGWLNPFSNAPIMASMRKSSFHPAIIFARGVSFLEGRLDAHNAWSSVMSKIEFSPRIFFARGVSFLEGRLHAQTFGMACRNSVQSDAKTSK